MSRRFSVTDRHVVMAQVAPSQYYGPGVSTVPSPRVATVVGDSQHAGVYPLQRQGSGELHNMPVPGGPSSIQGRRPSMARAPAVVIGDHQGLPMFSPGSLSSLPQQGAGSPGHRRSSVMGPHTVDNYLAQQGLERKRMPNDVTCMVRL